MDYYKKYKKYKTKYKLMVNQLGGDGSKPLEIDLGCEKEIQTLDFNAKGYTLNFHGTEPYYKSKKYPTNISVNDVLYQYDHKLGEGAYGIVVSYKSKDDKYISVKMGKHIDDLNDDILALEELNKNKKLCNEVVVSSLVTENKCYILMEHLSGTLSNIIDKHQPPSYQPWECDICTNQNKPNSLNCMICNLQKPIPKIPILNKSIILQIIKQITNSLICLFNIKLCYLDLKPANILYRCIKKTQIQVILGDIGSAVKIGTEGISTFPPPRALDGYIEDANQKDVVWSLGVLLLGMLDPDNFAVYFLHNTDKSKKNPPHYTYINRISERYDLKNFIPNLLKTDEGARWTLQQVEDNLKTYL